MENTGMPEYIVFPKIPRLSREAVITEKIDGTLGCVYIGDDGEFLVGSKSRWITPAQDNHGFAGWAYMHKDELMGLGPGWHHGEWWGQGIQRKYGLTEKRWSLFNTSRWTPETPPPSCCHIVPVLYRGMFDTTIISGILATMREQGSRAAPGFMQPEGVVIYHVAGNLYFKKTLEKDDQPKGAT